MFSIGGHGREASIDEEKKIQKDICKILPLQLVELVMNPGIRNSVEEPLLKGNFNTPEELHEKKVMAEG